MPFTDLETIRLYHRIDGDPDGAPVVFSNALGSDLRIWDKVIARLPRTGLKYIRYDMRGHGQTPVVPPPYTMGGLVRDAEGLLDVLGVTDAVFVGLSIGGMVAQGLAAKRLDLVRALVLSNTAARISTRAIWMQRITEVEAGGLNALAETTLARWFPTAFRKTAEFAIWRDMMLSTSPEGYIGGAHAIAGSDFYTTTAAMRLPTLGIAGSEDGSTPPDLVRETTNLVPGSRFHLIRKAGHIPCIDAAEDYARVLSEFIATQAH